MNKKLIDQIERFLSYRGPSSIAKQWSTTNEEAKEISNNCWKWFLQIKKTMNMK